MSKKSKARRLSMTSGTGATRCPFFTSHSTMDIRCEGIMDGVTHGMHFVSAARKKFYKEIYCDVNFEACEYYRMLMAEKYPE